MILRRRNPEKRMARFYSVTIQGALFGGWDVVREWGRIGSTGTLRTTGAYDTVAEACVAADRVIRRKVRRGYR